MQRLRVAVGLVVALLAGCGGGGGAGGGDATPATPPTISTAPRSLTVVAGHDARFAVVAAGTEPLTYQWSRDGNEIAGATSESYTLAAPTAADTGAQLQVKIANAAGSVSSEVVKLTVIPALDDTGANFVATWAAAQQRLGTAQLPSFSLSDSTVRQVVHLSVGGKRFRVRVSNRYGSGQVEILSAHLARTTGDWTAGEAATSSIVEGTDRILTFNGEGSVILAAGQEALSDSVELDTPVPALMNMSISLVLGAVPTGVSGHPGSRTFSYVVAGDHAADPTLTGARSTPRWVYIEAIEVVAPTTTRTVAVLGDSLTDGKGSDPNLQDRWTDLLAQRLAERHAADPDNVPEVAVVNLGLGGNNFLGGSGSGSGLDRFKHDVLGQKGVKWAIVFMGVNDIVFGNASAAGLENGYRQLVQQAKAAAPDLGVYGATLTPFGGYSTASAAAQGVRAAVNEWLRTYTGENDFDAILDFSAAVVEPGSDPEKLVSTIVRYPDNNNDASGYDATDYLHFNVSGYEAMVDAVDLDLFR